MLASVHCNSQADHAMLAAACPCDVCDKRVLPFRATLLQVLSNSYAFAYFFFGNDLYSDEFDEDQNKVNQNLFEDSQEMLAAEVRCTLVHTVVCSDPAAC